MTIFALFAHDPTGTERILNSEQKLNNNKKKRKWTQYRKFTSS